MGSWGITMRESDYGLDLLGAIVDRQLKALNLSTFQVTDAPEVIRADIMEEPRLANLAPGAYVIPEIKAPDGGYVIDTPSTNVVIGTNGDTQTVVIKNTRKSNLIIEKYNNRIFQQFTT